MSLILEIPSHLRSLILAEWLEINDLARLDVAIVKGSLRLEYLGQLAYDRLALSGIPKISPHSSLSVCLNWLIERDLCIKSVKFSITDISSEMQMIVQNHRISFGIEEVEFERLDNVDVDLFQQFFSACRNISKISLSFCPNLTDKYFSQSQYLHESSNNTCGQVQQIPRFFLPSLRHLLLNNCTALTDEVLQFIARIAPNLTKLHCRGLCRLTDESMRHIAQLSHLEDIDFGLCRLITDRGLRYLSQSKRLSILSSMNFYYCRNISDQGLTELSFHHTMIQSLNTAGCHLITDIGVSRIVTVCREYLLHLNLAGCIKLTHESVLIVASNCGQLRTLNLSNIKAINDQCIQSLWKNCDKLEKLVLKECDSITDAAFKSRGFVWPNLDLLDLTYCSHVGDAGLLQIATFCPLLRMLRMTGCKLSLPCLRRATSINEKLHINIEQE